MRNHLTTITLLFFALLTPARTQAQIPTPVPLADIHSQQQLDATILALHNAYFGAYNTCDLATFAALTDEHVEFYHDKGGLTLGRDALVKSIHDNICGRVTSELVPGSFKAFHMNNIGAIENATLRFHHPGHDDTEDIGECETVILWQWKDAAWKVTRVYSYDHHIAAKPAAKTP